MATGHLTARRVLAADAIVAANFPCMLATPCNRQPSAVCSYQTLWTDANWSDAIREKYILESVLPDDFVLSTYYARSREMLARASHKKGKSKVKKILTGSHTEDYRVNRLHEPAVGLKSLKKAQPVSEVLKRDEEMTSMHQGLNTVAALKTANKKYAQDLAEDDESATVFRDTLGELQDLFSGKEALRRHCCRRQKL